MENCSSIIYHNKILTSKTYMKRNSLRCKFTNEELDDGFIVNFPHPYTCYYTICPTVNIPLTKFFKRCGVIPYTIINENKYYCFGIDAMYGTLTDFGGSVKKYESFCGAAVRELEEESLGIFDISPTTAYRCSEAIYDANNIILFIYVKIRSMESIVKKFIKRYHNVVKSENSGILWVSEPILSDLVRTGKSIKYDNYLYPAIYKPVNDLLKHSNYISES